LASDKQNNKRGITVMPKLPDKTNYIIGKFVQQVYSVMNQSRICKRDKVAETINDCYESKTIKCAKAISLYGGEPYPVTGEHKVFVRISSADTGGYTTDLQIEGSTNEDVCKNAVSRSFSALNGQGTLTHNTKHIYTVLLIVGKHNFDNGVFTPETTEYFMGDSNTTTGTSEFVKVPGLDDLVKVFGKQK
jgi:hypothetical protein